MAGLDGNEDPGRQASRDGQSESAPENGNEGSNGRNVADGTKPGQSCQDTPADKENGFRKVEDGEENALDGGLQQPLGTANKGKVLETSL